LVGEEQKKRQRTGPGDWGTGRLGDWGIGDWAWGTKRGVME